MDRDALEAHIAKTMEYINTLPEDSRGPLLALVNETRQRHEAVAESTQRSLDAIDDWRLVMKYNIFDAEATLREQLRRPN